MVISGLHVNVRTSATGRISWHGVGRSSGLFCTDKVIKCKNVYRPNLSKFYYSNGKYCNIEAE